MRSTEPDMDVLARARDVDTRGTLVFGFWLAAAVIAVAGAMFVYFRVMEKKEDAAQKRLEPAVAASLRRTPPEPRLEPLPLLPRLKLRAEEDAILTSYAWVDRPGGFVRIPVERAMELIVERGLPPSKPMAATAAPPASQEPKR